jgi:hypothetical protein
VVAAHEERDRERVLDERGSTTWSSLSNRIALAAVARDRDDLPLDRAVLRADLVEQLRAAVAVARILRDDRRAGVVEPLFPRRGIERREGRVARAREPCFGVAALLRVGASSAS